MAVRYGNYAKFVDLGGVDRVNLNFKSNVIFDNFEAPEVPLLCAAARGDETMIRLILKNKSIDINVRDSHGINAIWLACLYGHGEVMHILAEEGIEVLVTNREGINLLHLAASQNYYQIVKMLLNSDFPIFKECKNGMTAFQIAALKGYTEILSFMIQYVKKNRLPKYRK